jgi:hypothetical protein
MSSPTIAELMISLRNLWGVPGLLILGICLASAVRLRGKWVMVLAMCLIAVIGSLFLISQVKPVFNGDRTPMLFLPAASVLVALLISRRKGFLTAAVLALVGLNSILSLAHDLSWIGSATTRESVAYVLERAQCDDTFVLGALSFAAEEYELRRLDAPDCIYRESFPLSTQSHPGWMNAPGLLAERVALQREASATANRLAEAGATVWLFYIRAPGDYQNITDILKLELDRRFDTIETIEARGLYFDVVLVYSNVTEP